MNPNTLEQYLNFDRRYSRSINLERDLDRPKALKGYILTDRAVDSLQRILRSFSNPNGNRAWTLTSVYGTGKSAFTHYLISACSSAKSPMRDGALEIAKQTFTHEDETYKTLLKFSTKGLVLAVATGTREPIGNTIIRGLFKGSKRFWNENLSRLDKIPVFHRLADLNAKVTSGEIIDSRKIPELVLELSKAAKTGVLIVIDELGKNLEYAAYEQGAEDLYVLQQLAELQVSQNPIYILGILHQAFSEYGQRLATVQRNEWAKIQGRFEDIPFTESASQMMRLIEKAINFKASDKIALAVRTYDEEWSEKLDKILEGEEFPDRIIEQVYPLHPLTAFVLPTLCHRYAQNDRSLFTFLTSEEPYGLKSYIKTATIENENLPTLKLDWLYDYFIEASGMNFASRPNLQRWVEIQDLIADARHLEPDYLRVLKTIGVLNLVTTTGTVRATKQLVNLALCDTPNEQSQSDYWERVIESLIKKGLVTHRRTLDELRLWQGSDFNTDAELSYYLEQDRSSLAKLLTSLRLLSPLVVQRHSYKTGTLRYFERHYLDSSSDLNQLQCERSDADGYVGYWLDDESPSNVPPMTKDGKPLILRTAANLDLLRLRSREYAALKKIQETAAELQSDGVARKEVRFRVVQAEQLFDETLERSFEAEGREQQCWVQGKVERIARIADFNTMLSEICDRVYSASPILWNELINRRDLTSQGTKARRELISAMVESGERERLGLEGYGPEVSMYYSLLEQTGIHRQEQQRWGFYPPSEASKVRFFWQPIEEFCLAATEKPLTLDRIYKSLSAPPYGIKPGAIPVMLAAVLLYHCDDVGVYRDGTYIPLLGVEHFELLVKDPSRYAVKYFEVAGLRSEVFKELEEILRQANIKQRSTLRNQTLLNVLTPLYQFVNRLPVYTKQTKRISIDAQRVLTSLNNTTEPDELLFEQLPQALGFPAIRSEEGGDITIAKSLRSKFVQVLREINTAYENLLSEGQSLLHNAFGVSSESAKLREELRVRSRPLVGKCVERALRSFTQAAVDEEKSDREWLEALLMIIADKPAESWTDDNVTGFEIKLSDLARRFKNLEALDCETRDKGDGFDARRITVTQPDGQETHRLVWVERDNSDKLDRYVEQVLQNELLRDNPQLQEAFVAKLTERVLGSGSAENVAPLRRKPQTSEQEEGVS